MNTQEFINFIPSFIDKLTKDGMSQSVIKNNKWIIDSFIKYCKAHKIFEIDMAVIQKFYEQQYNMDIYNANIPLQTMIRRPLLIFMEYYQYGNYLKTHQKSKKLFVPLNYSKVFKVFQENFVNNLNIIEKSKRRKLIFKKLGKLTSKLFCLLFFHYYNNVILLLLAALTIFSNIGHVPVNFILHPLFVAAL